MLQIKFQVNVQEIKSNFNFGEIFFFFRFHATRQLGTLLLHRGRRRRGGTRRRGEEKGGEGRIAT